MTGSPGDGTHREHAGDDVVADDSGMRDAHRNIVRKLEQYEAPGINTLVRGQTDVVLASADGARVTDVTGRSYLDLIGGFGVALLGHRHPQVLDAVRHQMEHLVHGLGDVYANPPRARLARRLAQLAPWSEAKVYPAISGSDAVEIAIKTSVLATGRTKVLAFDPAYHGLTLGALQPTSRESFRSPFAAHAATHVQRLPFGADPKTVHALLAQQDFAAVIFEPVVGREGVLFPPAGWLGEIVRAARASGTVSIADEIFTGFHRTGPRFAHLVDEEPADLICCGKALGGGWPIGAVLGRAHVLDAWRADGEARHTATFVGHPVSCAAANAVLDLLRPDWVAQRIEALESAFRPLGDSLPSGVSYRGRGALWAFEFERAEDARRLQHSARNAGILLLAGGPRGNVVQILPPLILEGEDLGLAVETLRRLVGS